jgi:ribosomal protein L11 methyltransferase
MLEGLPPNNAAHVMRLSCDEASARRIADLLVETFDPAEVAASAFESEPTAASTSAAWFVEVYFQEAPDEALVRELLLLAAGPESAAAAQFSAVDQKDWVASSLEGLRPVRAGRFVIHGAHDRGRVAPHEISLEIEAALAFGTGHHGTTRGCLLLFDAILKRKRPTSVLDVGTGTGVLAMAAAKALKMPIACGDIDPTAVRAAAANARANGLACFVRPLEARGAAHAQLRAGAPYDLIFANILAAPLRRMAPSLAALASRRADLVLSGLMGRDAAGVLSAYAAQGFFLAERLNLDGWTSLRLRRGARSSVAASAPGWRRLPGRVAATRF